MAAAVKKEFLNVRMSKATKLAFTKKAKQNGSSRSEVTQQFVDAYLEDRVSIRPPPKK